MVTPTQVQDASPSGAAVGYGPFDYFTHHQAHVETRARVGPDLVEHHLDLADRLMTCSGDVSPT